jgi:hypothetical protein
LSKNISTTKLSAAFRKLQDAQDKMMKFAKSYWAHFKSDPLRFEMEPFNAAASELNKITTAEGAQTSATLALNGLMHLASEIQDLKAENKSQRRRLERLESDAERKNQVSAEQRPAEVTTE